MELHAITANENWLPSNSSVPTREFTKGELFQSMCTHYYACVRVCKFTNSTFDHNHLFVADSASMTSSFVLPNDPDRSTGWLLSYFCLTIPEDSSQINFARASPIIIMLVCARSCTLSSLIIGRCSQLVMQARRRQLLCPISFIEAQIGRLQICLSRPEAPPQVNFL